MELIYKETPAERLISRLDYQASVTGDMPTPDGRTMIRVLSAQPRVELTSVKPGKGEIVFEGRVNIIIGAVDADGALFAYQSGAAFSHRIECENASPSMRADADANVISLDVAPSGASAALSADVDFDIRLISTEQIRACVGIKGGDEDIEIKSTESRFGFKRQIGSSNMNLREEIAADEAVEVISSESTIAIKETVWDNEGCTVSGIITVSAVTADKYGRAGQLVRQIPFRERLNANSRSDEAYCEARIRSLYIRSLGEEYSILALEAEVTFELFAVETVETEIPQDLFSVSRGIRPVNETARINCSRGLVQIQNNLKENITIPETMPAIGAVIYTSAFTVINDAYFEQGMLNVNGVLVTSVAYETAYGSKEAFRTEVPFSVNEPISEESDVPRIKANCIASAVASDERKVQVQYYLNISAEMITAEELSYVSSAEECEIEREAPGIIVVFASKGEEVFDIAKRYSVPCGSVRKLNPGIAEPFSEGDKLILMV